MAPFPPWANVGSGSPDLQSNRYQPQLTELLRLRNNPEKKEAMQRKLRRVTHGLAAAIAVAACNEVTPVDVPAAQPLRFALSDEQAEAFRIAVEDIRERIEPGLPQGRESIGVALSELRHAIETRDQHVLTHAIVSARSALAAIELAYAETGDVSNDLDALRLILEHAQPLLDSRLVNH